MDKNENPILSYWQKVDSLPEELKTIVENNWDYTGRPTSTMSESNTIVAVLNKNSAQGFEGFKNDMNLIFEDSQYPEHDLAKYYNVYMGGAQFIANKFQESFKTESSNKPKMK